MLSLVKTLQKLFTSPLKPVGLTVLLFTILSSVLTGCSTTSADFTLEERVVETLPLNIMAPELNQSHTVERGGVISHYETGYYLSTQSKYVELMNGLTASDEHPELKLGTISPLLKEKGEEENGIVSACFNLNKTSHSAGDFCLVDNDKNGYFEQGFFDGSTFDNLNIQYQINTHEVRTNFTDHIKKQLVYQGITVDKIKLTYLEFKNDMKTPHTTTNFTINSHRGNHILFNYKGAQFTIMKADNVNIIFESRSHLN